jgi:hypothetical protein
MGNLNSQDKPKNSPPSIKDKLENLILRSLDVDYISESCQDSISRPSTLMKPCWLGKSQLSTRLRDYAGGWLLSAWDKEIC